MGRVKIISPAPDSVFLVNGNTKRLQDCSEQELELLSKNHPSYFEITEKEPKLLSKDGSKKV